MALLGNTPGEREAALGMQRNYWRNEGLEREFAAILLSASIAHSVAEMQV